MVSATLAAVDAGLAAHGARLVMFSSFDPEVCMEVKRRCGFGAFVDGAVPGLVGGPAGSRSLDAWQSGVPVSDEQVESGGRTAAGWWRLCRRGALFC